MRKLVICDDEKCIVDSLAEQLEKIYPEEFIIIKYISSKQLVYDVEDESINNMDILIMDISMGEVPDKEGIDAAIRIKKKFPETKVLFLTGYPEQTRYIFQGLEPDGLLLKPITKNEVKISVDALLEKLDSQSEKDVLYVKSKGRLECVPYQNIQYVESKGRKMLICTQDRIYEEYGKLDEFCRENEDRFLRCHQSYAVNIRQIQTVTHENVTLYSGQVIRISRGRYAQVRRKMMEYMKRK